MNNKDKFELIRDWYNDPTTSEKERVLLRELCPELKESDGERIRKALVEMVDCTPKDVCKDIYKVDKGLVLSWLEKQGEQKSVGKIQLDKKYKCIASPRYSTFVKGFIYIPEDKFLCSLMNFSSDCFEPIEDGEQKPADNIEPKFKVGDWVVSPNGVWHIDAIRNGRYEVTSDTGECADWPLDTGLYHLWTIQDAKPGDVLVAHECLVLFKEIDGLNIRCYCTYHFMNNESFFVDTLQNKTAFTPATKEQCDTLMKAMANAGYTFDFEKKELKKRWTPRKGLCFDDYYTEEEEEE